MKKLIITAVLLLTLLTTQAQNQFEGMWVCDESSHITTILTCDIRVVKVFSFSFVENNILKEKIITQSSDTMTTSLHNKENGWKVRMEYKYIDYGTLRVTFSGDYTGLVTMTRLK